MADVHSENIYQKTLKPQRRVVVTGLSCLSPVGLTVESSWENLIKGQSGIREITAFDSSDQSVKIAGEIQGFNPDDYIIKKDQKKMDRFIHLAIAAADMAFKDADLEISEEIEDRAGCIVGVGLGGLPYIETQHTALLNRGPSRVSPFFIPAAIANLASGHISIRHRLRGPNYSVTSACASGVHSIGEAYKYIRDGQFDIMLAGGSESVVCPMAIAGFASMKALSTRNDNPAAASRPWDKDRDGFVLAEAAGMLILEDYEHAAKRGARIYGELAGYGVSSDAYHMTNPSPGGVGAAYAMENAIADARINHEEIDYVNAHGTSTPVGDEIETQAIKKVFKNHCDKLWVSSTKSMTGHALGAAGAIETVFSTLSLYKNIAPPTINLDNPSEDCDLDYVPGSAREGKFQYVLNNSFGFGGTNASVVLGKI
jgi:3-oxoacyl-[acyl-carrier-protein] synthase II